MRYPGDRVSHRNHTEHRPVSALDQGYTHPPFLLGADHVFEWRSPLHGFPLCIVTISINPLYHFPRPHLVVANSFTYQCPHLHLLHCQGGPQRSPEIQSTLVWSSCWGATGSAGRSMQRGEQRRVVRARGNKGEVRVTRDQCRVW